MDDMHDPRQARALARYQVIASYLADDPPRGQRGPLRRKLARRVWIGPDGEPFTVSAETIRKCHGHAPHPPSRRTFLHGFTKKFQEVFA
jgi:hypothetical protein